MSVRVRYVFLVIHLILLYLGVSLEPKRRGSDFNRNSGEMWLSAHYSGCIGQVGMRKLWRWKLGKDVLSRAENAVILGQCTMTCVSPTKAMNF